MTPVLVDASYLIAIYNRSDIYHRDCIRAQDLLEQQMVTCEAVIAEAIHKLQLVFGAASAILESVEQGILEIRLTLSDSAGPVRALMAKYSDTPCDFADACLIHLADQVDSGDILTLDSDFKHYRWRRNRRFRLLVPVE